MGKFNFTQTSLIGAYIIEPTVFGDKRGYFMETYNERDFAEAGFNWKFVQDNQSSSSKGVLRGLHFQKNHPQGKLVRVISGEVFDVIVDLRKLSDTFGKWYGTILSDNDKRMLYVPEGFAHGFMVLSDIAEFTYKCTEFYDPEDEDGIIWNDPDIGIEWPINDLREIKLSLKDRNHRTLAEIRNYLKF